MPNLKIVIPHNLSKEEVLKRIKNFLLELTSRHSDKISDVEETWSGSEGKFELKISGFKVSGNLCVKESEVLIKGDLPFLALPFKSQIETVIKEKAEQILKKVPSVLLVLV